MVEIKLHEFIDVIFFLFAPLCRQKHLFYTYDIYSRRVYAYFVPHRNEIFNIGCRMFGFWELMRFSAQRKLAGGHAGLISGRIKPGFVPASENFVDDRSRLNLGFNNSDERGRNERTYRRTEEFGKREEGSE